MARGFDASTSATSFDIAADLGVDTRLQALDLSRLTEEHDFG